MTDGQDESNMSSLKGVKHIENITIIMMNNTTYSVYYTDLLMVHIKYIIYMERVYNVGINSSKNILSKYQGHKKETKVSVSI